MRINGLEIGVFEFIPAVAVTRGHRNYEDEEEEPEEEELVAASSEQRRAAQNVVDDFTRNIQRKKDKEMAELQFAGGSSGTIEKKQAVSEKKAGRNDPCPCGSGKKYKKCHGA